MGEIISFNQYDKRDKLINTYTLGFEEFLKKVPNCKDYYYRLSCYKDTNRKIVSDVHFGCNISNIGSLYFNIPDFINEELNRRIQEYERLSKNWGYHLIFPPISFIEAQLQYWIEELNKNTSKGLDKELKNVLESGFEFTEIKDLNAIKGQIGIYILVFDEYNSFYIGQTTSEVKKRILSHWSKRKPNSPTDRLRAKDTTRIFFHPFDSYEMDYHEFSLILDVEDKHYIMNSVYGGKGNIALIHKDEKQYSREKYEYWSKLTKEIDKKYIVE